MNARSRSAGFTIMEMIMVIAIVAVLATMSILPMRNTLDESRFQDTSARLEEIQKALIGNKDVRNNGDRTSFGYLGDVGALPTTAQGLSALMTKPANVGAWQVASTRRISHGWNGPYLSTSQASSSILNDSWGRPFIYDSTTNPATVTSLGSDGAAGGTGFNSDITIQIPRTLTHADITGFVTQDGSPFTGLAVVDLYHTDGVGGLATSTYTLNGGAAGNGRFVFNGIPFGVHSLSVYVPDKSSAANLKLGPISLTVDQPNLVVPSNHTDLGSTISMIGPYCSNSGKVTLASVAPLSGGGRVLTLVVNATSTVTLYQFNVANGTTTMTYNQIQMPSGTAVCTGSLKLSPCPANADGSAIELLPSQTLGIGNNQNLIFTFSTTLVGKGVVKVYVRHSQGCDTLTTTAF